MYLDQFRNSIIFFVVAYIEILHIQRQFYYFAMRKISLWLDGFNRRYQEVYFNQISNSIKIVSVECAIYIYIYMVYII